jgi:CRISPR type I-E-associated protein CasB/Cse2
MTDKDDWKRQLVAKLVDLSDPADPDRAVLAHLRRGLGLPLDYTLGRVGWLFSRVPEWDLDAAVLVTGLFALTKGECPHVRPKPDADGRQRSGPNFGTAFGAGLSQEDKQQREKRFIDLLDTGVTELPHKLRQAVSLVARDHVELDWQLLIGDVSKWDDADRRVQKQWARGFWNPSRDNDESARATN